MTSASYRLGIALACVATFSVEAEELDLTDSVSQQLESCEEMLKQIRDSDCGGSIYSWFEGGHVGLGVSAYALSMEIKQREQLLAKFNGSDNTIYSPFYTITTRRRFFGNSDIGYEYALAADQASATSQTLRSDGKEVNVDLGTYAIGSLFAGQATLFYSLGGNDETPDIYSTLGLGLGAGYASIRGKAYLTDSAADVSAACTQAVSDIVAGDKTALATLKQQCPYEPFKQSGLGVSARILFDVRYRPFFFEVEASVVTLPSGKGLVLGASRYDYSPAVTSITAAYVFDI